MCVCVRALCGSFSSWFKEEKERFFLFSKAQKTKKEKCDFARREEKLPERLLLAAAVSRSSLSNETKDFDERERERKEKKDGIVF